MLRPTVWKILEKHVSKKPKFDAVNALLRNILGRVVSYWKYVSQDFNLPNRCNIPIELVPENCCQNMIMNPIANRLRLPGVKHSLQVTPSVAFSSSSIDARISAISCMTSGLSTSLHLIWASDATAWSCRPCLQSHRGLSLRKKRPMNMRPPSTSWIDTGTRHCIVLEGMCRAQP